MSVIKKIVRERVGRFTSRMLSWSEANRARDRAIELSRVCEIGDNVTIGNRAEIHNCHNEPSRIKIGANASIDGYLGLYPQGGRIEIGRRSFVGKGSHIWSACEIVIGDYVLISHNVNIFDNRSHSLSWRERRDEIDHVLPDHTPYAHEHDIRARPLKIEDDVWIGMASSIIGGVTIGRGAIIGAGSVVTKDVPPLSLVVGNPMRIVKTLDDQ